MANRIPQTVIDDLLARIDIVELINSRITLKKAGSNYVACCPFHDEKTPSFTVSPNKQFYHCFGCGAHGNAIGFLMAFERMEFIEAVEDLAHKAGIEIPQHHTPSSVHTDLYALMEKVANYYHEQLAKTPSAQTYLTARGLSKSIIDKFQIGFASDGWDNLLQTFGRNQTIVQQLFAAGLLVKSKQGRPYDRFRERIIFPIRDIRGRVIGFGGRALDNSTPKYLNSPETVIFHKGSELYGLYEAKHADQPIRHVIIVEGYMDVIALAQHDLTYTVATLGTATNAKHIQRLLPYTQDIIFCFDGDKAGRQAAWRALEVSLPLMRDGLQIRFLFLPEGEDPDSLIRKEGPQAFTKRINASEPLANFFFNHLRAQVDLNQLDGKARLAKLAGDFLEKLPAGVFKELMIDKLAKLIGMEPSKLPHYTAKNTGPSPIETNPVNINSPVRLAIALLLQHPQLAEDNPLPDSLAKTELAGVPLLVQLWDEIKSSPHITTAQILEHWQAKPEIKALAKLAMWELVIPESGIHQEFAGAIHKIEEIAREKTIQALMDKAAQHVITDSDKQLLMKLLAERQNLQSKMES